jgi:hypothetical protein
VFLAACAAGDRGEVKVLLGRGADIDTANVDGLTALHQVQKAVLRIYDILVPGTDPNPRIPVRASDKWIRIRFRILLLS